MGACQTFGKDSAYIHMYIYIYIYIWKWMPVKVLRGDRHYIERTLFLMGACRHSCSRVLVV